MSSGEQVPPAQRRGGDCRSVEDGPQGRDQPLPHPEAPGLEGVVESRDAGSPPLPRQAIRGRPSFPIRGRPTHQVETGAEAAALGGRPDRQAPRERARVRERPAAGSGAGTGSARRARRARSACLGPRRLDGAAVPSAGPVRQREAQTRVAEQLQELVAHGGATARPLGAAHRRGAFFGTGVLSRVGFVLVHGFTRLLFLRPRLAYPRALQV